MQSTKRDATELFVGPKALGPLWDQNDRANMKVYACACARLCMCVCALAHHHFLSAPSCVVGARRSGRAACVVGAIGQHILICGLWRTVMDAVVATRHRARIAGRVGRSLLGMEQHGLSAKRVLEAPVQPWQWRLGTCATYRVEIANCGSDLVRLLFHGHLVEVSFLQRRMRVRTEPGETARGGWAQRLRDKHGAEAGVRLWTPGACPG